MDDTEVDRIARLFPAQRLEGAKNPAPGYVRFLAEAIGVSKSTPAQWKRRNAGRVPLEHRPAILAAADAHGVSRAALAEIWQTGDRCPCCGQTLKPGTVHA